MHLLANMKFAARKLNSSISSYRHIRHGHKPTPRAPLLNCSNPGSSAPHALELFKSVLPQETVAVAEVAVGDLPAEKVKVLYSLFVTVQSLYESKLERIELQKGKELAETKLAQELKLAAQAEQVSKLKETSLTQELKNQKELAETKLAQAEQVSKLKETSHTQELKLVETKLAQAEQVSKLKETSHTQELKNQKELAETKLEVTNLRHSLQNITADCMRLTSRLHARGLMEVCQQKMATMYKIEMRGRTPADVWTDILTVDNNEPPETKWAEEKKKLPKGNKLLTPCLKSKLPSSSSRDLAYKLVNFYVVLSGFLHEHGFDKGQDLTFRTAGLNYQHRMLLVCMSEVVGVALKWDDDAAVYDQAVGRTGL